MVLRYLTAGESHGPGLTAILEGMPANVPLDLQRINADMARRQQGYGRGRRQQIETDVLEFTAGVRFGKTLGSPISVLLRNKDWKNWTEIMAVEQGISKREVTRPRPGHADLSGAMKYGFHDMRNVLERSSARETAMRVAMGAIAREFLRAFGVEIHSHVTALGDVQINPQGIGKIRRGNINAIADVSPVRCLDKSAEQAMMAYIDAAKKQGDTAGGIIELVIRNVPPGVGSYVHWDRKLDARLAFALMSIQAVKGVEVGMGFQAAVTPGSQVHDAIYFEDGGFTHKTNNAGGIEGGMSTGEEIVLKIAKKPIPTLMHPLHSVDLHTKESFKAHVERSDVTAVPACAVICEAVAAIVIADGFLEKFGADTLDDIRQAHANYLERLKNI